jgi:hypothetical protein
MMVPVHLVARSVLLGKEDGRPTGREVSKISQSRLPIAGTDAGTQLLQAVIGHLRDAVGGGRTSVWRAHHLAHFRLAHVAHLLLSEGKMLGGILVLKGLWVLWEAIQNHELDHRKTPPCAESSHLAPSSDGVPLLSGSSCTTTSAFVFFPVKSR